MKIETNRNSVLSAITGILIASTCLVASVSAQVKIPGVVAPIENGKRLPAKLIVAPVVVEFFEAPINTRLIEANVKEYTPGSSSPESEYTLNIEVDAQAHTITEISTSVDKLENGNTKKIYLYNEPKKLESIKCYKGSPGNWVLEQEHIYTTAGMGGNRSLPTRKASVVMGQDTTILNSPSEETYVYDGHMHLYQYFTQDKSHTYQYNNEHDLSSEKITGEGASWKLLEYVYQYDNGLWVKKEEFETSPDQPRYLKKTITRKITLQ